MRRRGGGRRERERKRDREKEVEGRRIKEELIG